MGEFSRAYDEMRDEHGGNMKAFDAFGHRVMYDGGEVYGAFGRDGKYGKVSVADMFSGAYGNAAAQRMFVSGLSFQMESLGDCLGWSDDDIGGVAGVKMETLDDDGRWRKEMQNTVGLIGKVVRVLNESSVV